MTPGRPTELFARSALIGGEDCARPFSLAAPQGQGPASPLIFSSPHSGRCYPRRFVRACALPLDELRMSEDFLVDRLFAAAPRAGCWLIAANRPRAWLDLNRAPWELDPEMFSTPLPDFADVKSPRVKAGLGVIPRIVSEGREINRRKLTWREARQRIDEGYFPYHQRLERLVRETQNRFGQAVLIDCHSMPATAARAMTPLAGRRPQIILGDCEGESCSPLLMDTLEYLFTRAGYRVSRNRVYTGGYITRHYGARGLGAHAIQIEINRELYMRKGRYAPSNGFPRLQEAISAIIAQLPRALSPLWGGLRDAAE